MKRILFLLIFISLAPGCITIPLSSDHRDEIDKVQSQIAVGLTTREDVILILGEPDVTRDRYIIYQKKEYRGGVYFWAPFRREGVVEQVLMDLYFEFDDYGVLTEYRVDKYDERFNTVE